MKIKFTLILLLMCSLNLYAQPADRCADVLRNGTFQSSSYRNNSYIQQIIHSRFINSSYAQSKSDTTLGFGATLGSYFFTGDYNQEQFRQKQEYVQKNLFKSLTATEEIDVAVTSGDPEILTAWRQCMGEAEGWLEISFSPRSAVDITGYIVWHPGRAGEPTGVKSTKIDENIYVQNGKVVAGASCLKAKKKIGTKPCRFQIQMPDAKSTLTLVANAEHGSAEAFLPPRMKLKHEAKPYELTDTLKKKFHRMQATPSKTVTLPQQVIDEGWVFDVSSAKIHLEIIEHQRWVHQCDHEGISADLFSVTYTYWGFGKDGGSSKDRNTWIVCQVHPKINIVRDKWEPIGS